MLVVLVYLQLELKSCEVRKREKKKHSENLGRASTVNLSYTSVQTISETNHTQRQMAGVEVEELVVHLEKNMDLSTLEQGVKLVGKALVNKTLNKWGVRNILRSSWKAIGEVEFKWVRDNAFIITVQDQSNAAKILD